jgi:HK97 family phage prohead protease
MTKREFRTIATDLEVRESGDALHFAGYAAVFDSESHGEVVRSSAFTKTLRENDDVRLLVNHDGVPLARTKSGTLTLSVDDRGLVVEADLDRANPTVTELASAMARGDLDQMSFAFSDYTKPDQMFDDEGVRNLREVRLFDVSLVTFPWYEATSAELNELDRALVALRNGETLTVEQRSIIAERASLLDEEEQEIETAPAVRTKPSERYAFDLLRLRTPA